MRWNTDLVKEYLKNNLNDEYELIGEFVRSAEKVTVLHKVCGKTRQVYWTHLKSGSGCGYCGHLRRR